MEGGSMHAHFDCFSGAAGDMMLAACLDAAGGEEAADALLSQVTDALRGGLSEMADEFTITHKRVWRGKGSLAARYVIVNSIYQHNAAPVPGKGNLHPSAGESNSSPLNSQENGESDHFGREAASHHELDQDHVHGHQHEHSHDQSHQHTHNHEIDRVIRSESADSAHDIQLPNHDHAHAATNQHDHHHGHSHTHSMEKSPLRNLPEIRRMLLAAPPEYIPAWVREMGISVFTELARAEASVHGATNLDSVHFHEVGAVDSIVDTIGTLLALNLLNVTTFSCSRLPLGEGSVRTEHGFLPVPAPATLYLMMGMPTTPGPPGLTGELVTPTAAALLKVLTRQAGIPSVPLGRAPQFTLRKIGVGAGSKDFEQHPNILRVMLADSIAFDGRRPENAGES